MQSIFINQTLEMLNDILAEPDKNTPLLIINADQLLIIQPSQIGRINVGEKWKNSDERKKLYDDLDKRISKDDPLRNRFEEIYKTINNI